jgi:hypothetical protein
VANPDEEVEKTYHIMDGFNALVFALQSLHKVCYVYLKVKSHILCTHPSYIKMAVFWAQHHAVW